MKNKLIALLVLTFLGAFNSPLTTAHAQSTAFTYQGRLNDGASPASGSYDFTFALYDDAGSGTPQGNALTNTATVVSNGLFTVTLDFGNQFPGADRWLEIAVRTNGGALFTTLGPRQQITAAPYAVTAGTAGSLASPPDMVLIRAGAFTIGDSIGDGDFTNATPTSTTVSAFYMDLNLVSYSQWQSVYFWATNHGYGFVNAGSGKAANHPVLAVDWYDCVKWCNARSQQAGRTPVYYTDAGLTQVYTNGEVATYVDWVASGYRLPTEAEWEKAARGGLSGQRFPWGNVINQNLANYYGATAGLSYDLGPDGYNTTYATGAFPYTSPVGSFAANGYGLNDMAGNVFEWCWDWYGMPYAGGNDPHGPVGPLSNRVMRGGAWGSYSYAARCAFRAYSSPTFAPVHIGFRCVRGL